MARAGKAVETAEGLGYEKVWAMFREIAERQAETALQMRETDRKMQETDRIVKELSKNIGGLHNALGKWTEELVSAKLWEKFNEMG
ncbi:MAG: hypothetical protein LBF95_01545, partial [Treponema sp.]|nr:hypothetical protein [Treponema sp.]